MKTFLTALLVLSAAIAVANAQPVFAAASPPSSLTAQVSGDTVVLSWSAAPGAVLEYRLQAGTGPGLSNLADVSVGLALLFTAPGVPPGTYYLRVRAFDVAGPSDPSNEVAVTVAALAPPAPPTGLAAAVTGGGGTGIVALSWTAPPGPVNGYRVEAGSGPGLSDLASFTTGPATQVTANAVPTGVYFVRVRAFNAAGASGPSEESIVVVGTPPCPVASAPLGVQVAITGPRVGVSWQPVSGAGITYSLEAGTASGLSNIGRYPIAAGTSMTASAPNGRYFLRVRTVNACGTPGPASVEMAVVVGGVAPTASAGPDQNVGSTAAVRLNGNGSIDPDGATLTFRWTLLSRPAGSAAVLNDSAVATPTFVPDRLGVYVAQLIVGDGEFDSAPDTVTITRGGSPPVANAGPDQTVRVLTQVQLNGSASSDPDGDALTFAWTFVSTPPGGPAGLTFAYTPAPTFMQNRAGRYVIQLVVSDGSSTSAADTVEVMVTMSLTSAPVVYAPMNSGALIRLRLLGGEAPYTGSIETGTMPPGLVFATCVLLPPEGCVDIKGTATQAGSSAVTVRVTDSLGNTALLDLTIVVTTMPVIDPFLPSGEKDVPYTFTLRATGGDGVNYAWSISGGGLPPGMTLNGATGVVSGTPTEGGAFDVQMQVISGDRLQQRWLALAVAYGPVPPTQSVAVLAALNESCQLRNNEITCWGESNPIDTPLRLLPTPPSGAVLLREIVDNFCGITLTGEAICWPEGYGSPPVMLPQSANLVSLGGGRIDGVCGLTAAGSISCWKIVLDAPNPPVVTGPIAVGGAVTYTAMAESGTRNSHNCGLTTTGAAYCWGWNTEGQLGDGTQIDAPADQPRAVVGGYMFASLSVGLAHTCGITTVGELYCWGTNDNGSLGIGLTEPFVPFSTVPLRVMPGTTFKPESSSTHSRLSCAVSTAGDAYCWGNVGIAFAISLRGWTPQLLPGGVLFERVRANHRRLCGIGVDGFSYCAWEGPLGDGSTAASLVPVKVLAAPP